MIRLILVVFLATSVFGNWRENGKIVFADDPSTTTEGETTTQKATTTPPTTYTCTKPGQQCSPDCQKVLFCAGSSGDAIEIDDCVSKDQLCGLNEDNKFVCSSNITSCSNDDLPVKCSGVGPYPSAYNCSLGYFCTGANVPPELKCECPQNTYYESGFCSKNVDGYQSCCEDPTATPKCSNVGDSGNFGSNCHIGFYYVCGREGEHLVANVFRCDLDEIFINGACTEVKNNIKAKEIDLINTECSQYNGS